MQTKREVPQHHARTLYRRCSRSRIRSNACDVARLLAAIVIATATLSMVSCGDPPEFQCGVDSDRAGGVQRCTEPRQVCICGTNSCAERLSKGDASCPSGFRYVKKPFARAGLAGTCVPSAETAWLVDEDDSGAECSVRPEGNGGEGGT